MPRWTLLTSLALAFIVLPIFLHAETPMKTGDWPQWRGPNRDGLAKDIGLLKAWPKNGPPLLWETKGAGRGFSSISISARKIYTMGDAPSTAMDKDAYVTCFEEATGKQLWKTRIGKPWDSGNESYKGGRSTPTIDGDSLYVVTPYGFLVCLDTVTGKERWNKSLEKEFSGKKADGWGFSESVLIDGDKVVCTPGGPKATMVALNKKTGETIWTAPVMKDPGAGHASIVISEIGGTRVYVQTTGGGAIGVRANDGKVLWTYPIDRTTAVIPTPIVQGDLVFFTAGYGRGGALLKQVPGKDGAVKIEQVYGLKPALQNRHGGVVLVGDNIYADTDHGGSPWCADLKTGKVYWKKRGSGGGSAAMAYADGYLYLQYEDGTMALAKATPDEYKESGAFKILHSGSRPSWAHPVIAGGKLYIRYDDYLLCYDLRAK